MKAEQWMGVPVQHPKKKLYSFVNEVTETKARVKFNKNNRWYFFDQLQTTFLHFTK